MGYVYAVMWLLIGLILVFRMGKENKVFYIAGGYFLLLGAWWMLDMVLEEVKMFEGALGIALKVISGIALVIMIVYFIKYYNAGRKKSAEEIEDKEITENSPPENKDW